MIDLIGEAGARAKCPRRWRRAPRSPRPLRAASPARRAARVASPRGDATTTKPTTSCADASERRLAAVAGEERDTSCVGARGGAGTALIASFPASTVPAPMKRFPTASPASDDRREPRRDGDGGEDVGPAPRRRHRRRARAVASPSPSQHRLQVHHRRIFAPTTRSSSVVGRTSAATLLSCWRAAACVAPAARRFRRRRCRRSRRATAARADVGRPKARGATNRRVAAPDWRLRRRAPTSSSCVALFTGGGGGAAAARRPGARGPASTTWRRSRSSSPRAWPSGAAALRARRRRQGRRRALLTSAASTRRSTTRWRRRCSGGCGRLGRRAPTRSLVGGGGARGRRRCRRPSCRARGCSLCPRACKERAGRSPTLACG